MNIYFTKFFIKENRLLWYGATAPPWSPLGFLLPPTKTHPCYPKTLLKGNP